jgi:hypothetical protein
MRSIQPKKRLTEEGVAKLKAPLKGKEIDYFDAGMPAWSCASITAAAKLGERFAT